MTSNGEYSTQSFSVSHRIGKECTLSDILEGTSDPRYFLSKEAVNNLIPVKGREIKDPASEIIQIAMMKSHRNNPNPYRVYDKRGIAPTINKAEGGGRIPYIKTTDDSANEFIYGTIRKLTPRECMRLQGVDDGVTDKLIKAGISDTQLYRAAGDAVTVNVVNEVAKKMMGV